MCVCVSVCKHTHINPSNCKRRYHEFEREWTVVGKWEELEKGQGNVIIVLIYEILKKENKVFLKYLYYVCIHDFVTFKVTMFRG